MNHEIFMQMAIDEAKKAYKINEVPIGAVVIKHGKLLDVDIIYENRHKIH